MSTVEEIKSAFERLTLEERAEVARFVHGWREDAWDEQIKRDISAGKLDQLLKEVDAAIDADDLEGGRSGATHRSFWQCLNSLPQPIQDQARAKFAIWSREPFHASLQFKELRSGVWSVRINDQYRALAKRKKDIVVWFWIGSHAEYDRLIG